MEPDAWLKTLYAAMKPGAMVGVIDHVALPRRHPRDRRETSPDRSRGGQGGLRSAPASSSSGVSDILRNPADDHSLLVFDPAIRGKTDRFVYKFRKPR